MSQNTLKKSACYFNVPHVLLIPNLFDGALDEACFVPWWTLHQALAAKGRHFPITREAFTYELGSQETINMQEALQDVDSILSYLSYKHLIVDELVKPASIECYACWLEDYQTIYAPRGGLVEYNAKLGTLLPAGTPLATMLNVERFGEDDAVYIVKLEEDVLPILCYSSGSVYQGAELYKVFYQYHRLS